MKHAKDQERVYKNWIIRWLCDFAHPASYDRAYTIENILWKRHRQAV
ncbi:hypothetical protein KBB68_03840 [Candidatus Babeliales bacterium]|nr:hypothetical protein [Candidatus Babeliales bacterium]